MTEETLKNMEASPKIEHVSMLVREARHLARLIAKHEELVKTAKEVSNAMAGQGTSMTTALQTKLKKILSEIEHF